MRQGFLAVISAAGLLAGAPTSNAAETGQLSATVLGLRSPRGRVGCTLYHGPRGFPVDPTAALQQRWCKPDGSQARCSFSPVPAGSYAVACFHDENDNGVLDRGFLGIPSEGTAVSNHAKGRFGPPKFDDAKFSFNGRALELVLRVAY